jgi:exosortase H (IPTLxxWG-CTERM-specific)
VNSSVRVVHLTAPPVVWYQSEVATPRPLRFLFIFAVCLLIGFGVLMTAPVQKADVSLSPWLVGIAHKVVLVCGGHATREAAILRAPSGFGVEMSYGCNAVNVTILLWSAVLAFPASWKMKALGLAAGSVIIQIVNILRFISLFYLGQYSMTWFDFAHTYLWETFLMLDTMVVFWFWVSRVQRNEARYASA